MVWFTRITVQTKVYVWIGRMCPMSLSLQSKPLDEHVESQDQLLHVLWQATREANWNPKFNNLRYLGILTSSCTQFTSFFSFSTHFLSCISNFLVKSRMPLRSFWSKRGNKEAVSVWWASWTWELLLWRLWLMEVVVLLWRDLFLLLLFSSFLVMFYQAMWEITCWESYFYARHGDCALKLEAPDVSLQCLCNGLWWMSRNLPQL